MEIVDFDFPLLRMAYDKRLAGPAFLINRVDLIRDKIARHFCKEGWQDYSGLPRGKQNFSVANSNLARLIERALQEFAHSMLKGESGSANWKKNCLHR